MLWLKQGKREGELVACTLLHHVPWANLEGCDAEKALRTMGPVAQSRCKDEDTEDPEVKWFIDCPTDNIQKPAVLLSWNDYEKEQYISNHILLVKNLKLGATI